MKRLTICIDFDGTLHDPRNRLPGYKMGQPVPGARDALRMLNIRGYDVVVCTARPDVEHVRQWLSFFGMLRYVCEVTHEKPMADLYVDDKGYRFTVWDGVTLDQITKRMTRPHQ